MALTANANVDRLVDQELRMFPVGAAVHIYRGALVGRDPAGHLKPFVPGDEFVGVSYEEFDNTAGSAGDRHPTSGAAGCRAYVQGDFLLTLAGAALTDHGKALYATSDSATGLTGHPDAFIGRILHYETSNTVLVRLRQPGEQAPEDGSSINIEVDFANLLLVDQDETVATLNLVGTGLRTAAIGTGLTAGATGLTVDDAIGELEMLLDDDSEAQNLTLKTQQVFNIAKGVTFEFEGRNKTAGGAATDDFDFGLMGLAGGITSTEEADMNVATSGLLSCLFHVDTNALSILASSDDNSSPISATDTLIDNSLTVNKKHKVICRPSGACELWIDGVRALASTAFSVGASGLLAGIVNLEKSTGTGVPEVRCRKLRMAGAIG